MTYRIIIAGGREFDDLPYMRQCMSGVLAIHQHKGVEVVSGGCRGADDLGEVWANEQGLPCDVRDADWKRLGRKAGLVRNEEMAVSSQCLCAFWDGHSRGTRHMIGCAIRGGLEVHIFPYDGDHEEIGDLFDEAT